MNFTLKEKRIILYVKLFALHKPDVRSTQDIEELWTFIGKTMDDTAKNVEDIWNSIKTRYVMSEKPETVKSDSLYSFLEELRSLQPDNVINKTSTETLRTDMDSIIPTDSTADANVEIEDHITGPNEYAKEPGIETNKTKENMEIDEINNDPLATDSAKNQESSISRDSNCDETNGPKSILDIDCIETDNRIFFDNVAQLTKEFPTEMQDLLRVTDDDWHDIDISLRNFIEQEEQNLTDYKTSQEEFILPDIIPSSDVPNTLSDIKFESVEIIFDSDNEAEENSTSNMKEFKDKEYNKGRKRKHSGDAENSNKRSTSAVEVMKDIQAENMGKPSTDIKKPTHARDYLGASNHLTFYRGLADSVCQLSKKTQKQLRLRIGVLLAKFELEILKMKMPE